MPSWVTYVKAMLIFGRRQKHTGVARTGEENRSNWVHKTKKSNPPCGNNKKWQMHDRIWRDLSSPPGAKVHGVQNNAEQVGGNKAQLRCLKSNHANNYTIKCRDNPAFPMSFPD
jgi:hypothetical protein